MTDPTRTGALVLDALAEGRRRGIAFWREYAEHNERVVREALDFDILAGHPERGRAARIARAVRGRMRVYVRDGEIRDYVSSKGVAKILERLSGGSDSTCFDPPQSGHGDRE